ncbi:MAG: hypothetical protein A3E82_04175 [Gammaproteobacteria bacterium RIFCSPHIGHO2_12_FULL_38_11]|nr:MAG: hypothetical protein A3E82_04175 [Gammaproteobacteria bacterium RIFCSPHIGHO2_12_FULL_38_11]
MKFKGKLLGTLFGLMFGPIGMALGFIAGHLYDLGYFRAIIQATQGNIHTHAQQVFFASTFKIMGYIAKSDGHVSENEIQTARAIMSKMGLNDTQKEQAIYLFSLGKKANFNINQTLLELRQVCIIQPALLQLFLDIQLQMASAEGYLSAAKKETLQHICAQLGIRGFQFNANENQHYSRQHHRSENTMTTADAYQILGVTRNSTSDEIKKAYRRLMSQNHPDKLISKGLPPEMIKVATEKTQRIKKAYEIISSKKH